MLILTMVIHGGQELSSAPTMTHKNTKVWSWDPCCIGARGSRSFRSGFLLRDLFWAVLTERGRSPGTGRTSLFSRGMDDVFGLLTKKKHLRPKGCDGYLQRVRHVALPATEQGEKVAPGLNAQQKFWRGDFSHSGSFRQMSEEKVANTASSLGDLVELVDQICVVINKNMLAVWAIPLPGLEESFVGLCRDRGTRRVTEVSDTS